jgi:DNA-binding GntR family transcriptional regulator
LRPYETVTSVKRVAAGHGVAPAESRQSAPAPTTPAARRRDRDAVSEAVDALREMIATGQIEPGAELSQVSLAKTIGVSTTPLREALRRLEAEGLVESRRNRSPRVPPFDAADLDAVYGSRIMLESLGIALAVPRLGQVQLEALQATGAEMRQATDLNRWDALHAAFHIGLMGPAGAPLGEEITRLMVRSDPYRRMSVRANGAAGRRLGDQEHEAILRACELRHPSDAALLLARHLARSALTVLANLAPDFEPVTVRGALQMVSSWAG